MNIRRLRSAFVFTLVCVTVALIVAWTATVSALPTAPAASQDCNIWWAQVLHDTFDPDYRSTVGPTTPGDTIKLRLRVAQSDLTGVRVRVWNDRTDSETYYNMSWDSGFDTDPTTYDWWYVNLPVGGQATILYYFFELNDAPGWCGADQDFYVDDDVKFYGGGLGAMNDGYDDGRSFQITVYDPGFATPEWMQRGVVYQIFPDRFRDQNSGNSPAAGRFFYDRPGGTIARSQYGGLNSAGDWNFTVCDPRDIDPVSCYQASEGYGYYSDNFYGGDLAGITDKIEAGYFDSLGISVLYLNPIFRSPSNHKYDTADYMVIDPDFGTLTDFQDLIAAADAHNMQVILDGVFNHTSSDSAYFDRYSRYDAAGTLTSPGGVGADDNSGACESPNSPYRSWYYIPDIGSPGNQPDDRCDGDDSDDPSGPWLLTYESWWGYGSLPKLRASEAGVRNLVFANGVSSVGPYWIDQGADGWRFDVGDDVDPGLTHDPANDFWELFRSATQSVNSDTLMVGEVWGDASQFLLGGEWDSVMNYRFRSALLSWLMTGCSGNGCGSDGGGVYFEDNDSNMGSSSGEIRPISPSAFNARLRSIEEDYPPVAFRVMMNLAGSHDTNRVRFLLKKGNNNSDAAAVQRMKEWWLFSFTYPGAPTLYYGDEIGLNHDGEWSGKWEDDPYNRIPFPWPDASGGSYAYNAGLLDFSRYMSSVRHSYRALQDGDVQHGMIIDDANKVYGFGRTNGSQTALIALNRDTVAHNATFSGLNASPYNLPDGTLLVDALSGATFTVASGSVTASVSSTWGVVLLEQNKIDTPANVMGLAEAGTVLSWSPVTVDTGSEREVAVSYTIHADTNPGFVPGPGNLISTVAPPMFGSPNGIITGTAPGGEVYAVCAWNAPGIRSTDCAKLIVPTAVGVSAVSVENSAEINWLWLIVLPVLAAIIILIRRQHKTTSV